VKNKRKNSKEKQNNNKTKSEKAKKQVLLSENDILWPQLRHMHIQDTIDTVLNQFNEFITSNKAIKLQKGGVDSISEMSEAIRAMPQYQEQLNKYSLHIQLTGECMKLFKDHNLEVIALLEQDMAMGEDAEGRPLKNLINNLEAVLQDPRTNPQNKMRLLMTYIISQSGIKDADRRKLMEAAHISQQDQNAISNLFYLGVALTKASTNVKKERKSKNKKRVNDVSYDLSRYIPALKGIVEALLEENLPVADYPFVKDGPSSSLGVLPGGQPRPSSAATSGRRWHERRKGTNTGKEEIKEKDKDDEFAGPRVIVFVAGGITYSETRAVYEVTKTSKRQVLIGSTSILTPKIFVENLAKLKKLDALD